MGTDGDAIGHITFKYIFPDDYNPTYVNGVYGGINPKGDLVLNFFLERPALPKKETFSLMSSGTLGPQKDCSPEDLKTSMVRFISTGIVLDLRGAKEICGWMKEKIVELEKFQQLLSEQNPPEKKE